MSSKQSIAAGHARWQANIEPRPLRKRLTWAIGVSRANTFWALDKLGRDQLKAIYVHQSQVGDLQVRNDRQGKKRQL